MARKFDAEVEITERRGGRRSTTHPKGPAARTATGLPKGHRKDGTFRKQPRKAPPKICSVRGCGEVNLALGLCRKHYDRNRKWGSPLIIGRPGGPRSTPLALSEAGITARQRSHWISLGLLPGVEQPDGRYVWNAQATRTALLIHRLTRYGLALEKAAQAAAQVVRTGRPEVTLGPGVTLVVQDDTKDVSAR